MSFIVALLAALNDPLTRQRARRTNFLRMATYVYQAWQLIETGRYQAAPRSDKPDFAEIFNAQRLLRQWIIEESHRYKIPVKI